MNKTEGSSSVLCPGDFTKPHHLCPGAVTRGSQSMSTVLEARFNQPPTPLERVFPIAHSLRCGYADEIASGARNQHVPGKDRSVLQTRQNPCHHKRNPILPNTSQRALLYAKRNGRADGRTDGLRKKSERQQEKNGANRSPDFLCFGMGDGRQPWVVTLMCPSRPEARLLQQHRVWGPNICSRGELRRSILFVPLFARPSHVACSDRAARTANSPTISQSTLARPLARARGPDSLSHSASVNSIVDRLGQSRQASLVVGRLRSLQNPAM